MTALLIVLCALFGGLAGFVLGREFGDRTPGEDLREVLRRYRQRTADGDFVYKETTTTRTERRETDAYDGRGMPTSAQVEGMSERLSREAEHVCHDERCDGYHRLKHRCHDLNCDQHKRKGEPL